MLFVKKRVLRTKYTDHEKGFTSVELIIVIIMLGILAATVMSRSTFSVSDYSAMAADQLIADVQYIQIKAMGSGARQSMAFKNNSGNYCLCNATGCTVDNCSTKGEVKTLPGNIIVVNTSFGNSLEFNTLGEPTYGTGDGTINLSNTRNVTVHGITGKAE